MPSLGPARVADRVDEKWRNLHGELRTGAVVESRLPTVEPVQAASRPESTRRCRPAWTADALAALVLNGYNHAVPATPAGEDSEATWRDAVGLRVVSRACRAAVDSEEFWRIQFELLLVGKVFVPPAIQALVERRTTSQHPYREAFALGLQEGRRSQLTVDDLASICFRSRLTTSAGSMLRRQERCPWWRGEASRRHVFARDMRLYALTLHDGADGLDMNIHKLPGLGTWRVIDAPPGCASGWYVCVVTPNSEHGLWKIHRFPDWSVMLLTTGAVKCSWEFPRRHKDPWTHELGVDDEQDVCPCADGKWQVNLSSLMSRIEEKPLLAACVAMDRVALKQVGSMEQRMHATSE
jgi:hypothetical protein